MDLLFPIETDRRDLAKPAGTADTQSIPVPSVPLVSHQGPELKVPLVPHPGPVAEVPLVPPDLGFILPLVASGSLTKLQQSASKLSSALSGTRAGQARVALLAREIAAHHAQQDVLQRLHSARLATRDFQAVQALARVLEANSKRLARLLELHRRETATTCVPRVLVTARQGANVTIRKA